MSNEKMGLFIAELRKSQNMTQKDLAEKLNVTDKAVSKWERGLCYPDIALLSPLASTLGITAGELLNGEKDENTNPDTNQAIDNVLQYADKAVKIRTKSTRKRTVLTATGVAMLVISLMLMFYPNMARWRNVRAQQRIIQYADIATLSLSQAEIDEHFRRAEEFNTSLRDLQTEDALLVGAWADLPEVNYYSILNINGIMGRLEIPSVNINLPILHGTTSAALDRGAGLLEGTAFPIGGYGNHPVIFANSGMRHAPLFNDLEHIEVGDIFFIVVLDRRMAYEVDSISRILPTEVNELRAIPDADVVTLVTSTPYRINSHRLLVRGRRIEYISYTVTR